MENLRQLSCQSSHVFPMTDSWTYLQPPEDSVCACVCMYEHMHVLVYMCMYMHVGNVGVSFGTRCREEDISIGWMSPVSWTLS